MKIGAWVGQWKNDLQIAFIAVMSIAVALIVTLIWTIPVSLIASLFDNDPSRDLVTEWSVLAWIVLAILFGPGIVRKCLSLTSKVQS